MPTYSALFFYCINFTSRLSLFCPHKKVTHPPSPRLRTGEEKAPNGCSAPPLTSARRRLGAELARRGGLKQQRPSAKTAPPRRVEWRR